MPGVSETAAVVMVTRWGGRQTYRPTIWHRDGKREELEWAKVAADAFAQVGFSPDGQALAMLGGVPGGIDAWTLDLSSKTVSRATCAEDASALAWFADGQLLARQTIVGGPTSLMKRDGLRPSFDRWLVGLACRCRRPGPSTFGGLPVGDEVFFSVGTTILTAAVSTTPTVRVGASAILLRGFPVSCLTLSFR